MLRTFPCCKLSTIWVAKDAGKSRLSRDRRVEVIGDRGKDGGIGEEKSEIERDSCIRWAVNIRLTDCYIRRVLEEDEEETTDESNTTLGRVEAYHRSFLNATKFSGVPYKRLFRGKEAPFSSGVASATSPGFGTGTWLQIDFDFGGSKWLPRRRRKRGKRRLGKKKGKESAMPLSLRYRCVFFLNYSLLKMRNSFSSREWKWIAYKTLSYTRRSRSRKSGQ